MPEETFDKDKIKGIALNTDDLWLKVIQIKNNIKVVKAMKRDYFLFTIKNSQSIALFKTNLEQGKNTEVMEELTEYYKIKQEDFNR